MGHALHSRVQIIAIDCDQFVIVLGQHGFEIGELSGQLPRSQQPRPDTEVEGRFIFGELDHFHVRRIHQRFQFIHRFFGDQRLHLPGDALEFLTAPFNVGQAVPIRRDHGNGLRLQHHRRAI